MKITILTGQLYPIIGGTELASWNTARELAKRGHEVTVISRLVSSPNVARAGKEKPYNEYFGGKLIFYRTRSFQFFGGGFLTQTLVAFKKMWRHPPDVMLAFTLIPIAFSAVLVKYLLMLFRFKRVSVVAWGRGSDVLRILEMSMLKRALVRFMYRFVRRSDLILVLTPVMKEKLAEFGCEPEKIRILGNAIDLSLYHPPEKRPQNTVLYVGGARREKGLTYLISAVNQMPKVKMTVVGGWGEEHHKCKKMAKRNIKFVGTIPPQRVKDHMAKATVLALPSLSEGFGIVLLEAMAMGLPIVASDVGGIPYVLGDAGLLVPPGNVDELRKALVAVLSNKRLQMSLSKKGLVQVQRFGLVAHIEKLVQFLEEAQ